MTAKPLILPFNADRFRKNTPKHASFAGVERPGFVCAKCKQARLVSGRKQAVKGTSKYGYVCRECAS